MRAAQFVKGKLWDETKQDSYEQSYESPNIETFLPYEKYAKLRTQRYITEKPKQQYFRVERVLTLIEVKEANHVDSAGRSGLVTHGVLVDLTHSFRHDNFPCCLDEAAFLNEILDDKWRLKMPPFPELKKPLDVPHLEWEVQP